MSAALEKGFIFVLEDDDDLRESYMEVLESEGYRAMGCKNGEDCLLKLKSTQESVALFIVDLSMPVMDGLDFIKACETNGFRDSPKLVITGSNFTETAMDGVNAILHKPIDMDDFLGTVNRLTCMNRGRNPA